MKKIKIALIYSSSGFGGMVTNLAKIVNCLHRDQFEILLISLESNNPVASLINPDLATKFVELDCHRRLDFQAIAKLRQILIAENINLLSLHGYKANFYGLLSSLCLKLKKISTIHGWVSQTLKLKFYQKLDQLIILLFDHLIAVSPAQFIRHPYLRLFKTKISVIENAIDQKEMSILKDQELAKDTNTVILGCCSRLAIEKRVEVIILACAKLKMKNWKLVIIGEGEERKRLKELRDSLGINSKIEFLGYQKDVRPYLHYFDIYITASSIEGLPNSLLEAGVCNNAVIVSDIPEHTIVIQNEFHGLHFPLDNAIVLAERIDSLILDSELRVKLANNLEQHLITNYSIHKRQEKFNNLFLKIATSH